MAPQLRRPVLAAAALAAAAALVAGCGDDEPADPTEPQEHGCAAAEQGRVTIVALDLAWDVDCLQAPEGDPLTIVVDNQDDGVAHNLRVTGLPGKPTTALRNGPDVQELELDGDLRAGEYPYICDIHPNMTGQLEVLSPLEAR